MTDFEELLDVESVDDLEALDTDDLPNPSELELTQLGSLVELATSTLESVTAGEEDPSAGKLQALLHLVNLIQGVLTTSDIDELLDTIDLDDLDSVVALDELPDAVESGELGDAVELKNIKQLIEFGQLWGAVDLSELMDSKDEITETVGQITGDDEGEEGVLETDLFDEMELSDMAGDDGVAGGLTEPEMIQSATQAQLDDAIDGFRDLLVETHIRLNKLRETNEERFEGVDQPSSRNPTAVSTLATHGRPPKAASTVSTVPRNVRHSTGPSRRRIYGRRFERLMAEKRGEDNGGED